MLHRDDCFAVCEVNQAKLSNRLGSSVINAPFLFFTIAFLQDMLRDYVIFQHVYTMNLLYSRMIE